MKFFSLLPLLLFFMTHAIANDSVAKNAPALLSSVVKIKVQRTDTIPEESELIQNDTGGSGFVFDAHHHILTNAHVIKDAKKIAIVDLNNTEYPATLVAKDDKSDIAILEAASFNAPQIAYGQNAALSIGDSVFVIGSPYSLGLGVTVGVVSSLQRYLPNYPYQYFIQTDAAINPGNSGGPMFNRNGELIGVATMTFSKSGSYTNIGFAIPIQEALRIGNLLIRDKKIERGYLGAEFLISDKVSRKMGYQASLLITRIESKSPANDAGLKAGDLLIELNDEKFYDSGALHRFLNRSSPNDQINISYIRDKKRYSTTVTLTAAPVSASPVINVGTGDSAEKLGLILQETVEKAGIEVVLSYASAKTAGFASGDMLHSVNATAVKTIKEFNTQLAKLKENEITMITLRRNGDLIRLPLGSKTALQGYTTAN
ncbi:MAG TPA: trypsin-like peptidase domain-containing protein [Sulfuricurvum sp.]|nr:trypsin-like peptidase domain-containing protein [Sulfuricurvum sp.]